MLSVRDAAKRLEAIESMEDLGAGFVLATHELRQRARLVLPARLHGHGKNLLPQPANSATARAASAMARCA